MRRRLVLVALAVTSSVVLAFLVPLAVLVEDLAHDRAITNTENNAESLARSLAAIPIANTEALESSVEAFPLAEGEALAVVLADGSVVGHLNVDTELVERSRRDGAIVVSAVAGGEAIAVPVVSGTDVHVVYGFSSNALLRRNVAVVWAVLGALALFSIGVAVALADRLAKFLVEPVEALSNAATTLSEGDLATRVEPGGPPEIEQTGHAFNLLAGRIGELISNEREAIADTSHRLRTPLTALQLDVEAVTDHEVRARLQDDVAEMERTVDHVIRQARRPVREGVGVTADLVAVVRARADFWEPLAEEQGRPWSVSLPDHPVAVSGHVDDVGAAFDALVTNVFAHTEEGAACEIEVTPTGLLTVIDEGHGFDPAFAERGKSGAGSTGLGLDIARQAVEVHGGTMEIESSAFGGTTVSLRFAHRA